MQVSKNNITQFLTRTNMSFMVPVYQRNYDWSEENCKQLWNDLWVVSQGDGTSTHFLGTICSKTSNGHEKTIIDGQQRITTITLLMLAMHDYVDNADFKKDLDSTFLRNNGYGVSPKHRVKLHLNRRDDAIYNKLLGTEGFVDADSLTRLEANSHIYLNYVFFYHCLQGLTEVQIADIRSSLDRIVIVDLDVENENPQEIFESLNSTGLDLTDVDLLRNFLLMSLDYDTQVRLYDDYWYPIEENVGPGNMVRFFVDYLIFIKRSDAILIRGRRQHINERNLYHSFKDYYQNLPVNKSNGNSPEATESLLKSMHRYSLYYQHLVFDAGIDIKDLDIVDRAVYSIVYINQTPQARPILLYIVEKFLTNKITREQALEMFNACLSLVFRAKVTGATGINGQFAGNMLQRLPDAVTADIVDRFWQAITSGSGRYAFPTDAVFKDALLNRPIFDVLRAKGTRYLLYSLELSAQDGDLPGYDDPSIVIEHVMPKALSASWEKYLGSDVDLHDDYLNKLGNLALVESDSVATQDVFTDKREAYGRSAFAHTRRLGSFEKWSVRQIRSRSVKLANLCLTLWSLPEGYQPVVKEQPTTRRRPAFRFSMVGLVKGDEICFVEDLSKVATVHDDSRVRYNGEIYSLSALAALFLGRESSYGIAGPYYFSYDGETLAEMRDEIETNMY